MNIKPFTGLAFVASMAAMTPTTINAATTLVPSSSELIFDGLQGAVIDLNGLHSITDGGARYTKATPAGTSTGFGFTNGADDAGFHTTDAFWVSDNGRTDLVQLSNGASLGGFNAPTFGVGNTIADDYVAVGNSVTNTIDLRYTDNLNSIAQSIPIDPSIVSTFGSTFSGLGTYLAEGGNPNNPNHYVAGITTSTGGLIEMNLGNPSETRVFSGLGADASDVAYGNGALLSTSDLSDSGVAGYARTFNQETANKMSAIPEPGALGLLGLGGLALLSRRNKPAVIYAKK